jgi:hypothetical protein
VQAQINKKNGALNKTRELRLYSDTFYPREVGSANTPQT